MSGPPSPTAETYPAQPEHEPNGQVSADLPPCERAPPEEEPPETTTDTARLCDGSTEDVTQDDVTEVPSYDTVITVQPEPAHDGMTAETQPLTELSVCLDGSSRDRHVSFVPVLGCEECLRNQEDPYLTESRGFGKVFKPSGQRLNCDQFMQQEDHPIPKPDRKEKQFCFCRFWSCFLHVGVFICVVLLLWIHFNRKQMFIDQGLYRMYVFEMGITGAFGLLGYVLIIGELINSEATPYMSNIKNLEEVQKYAHGLRHAKPKVVVRVTTYTSHTYRGVTNHDVVAFREKRELPITRWKDVSKELNLEKQIRMNPICKLRLKTTLCFLDQRTVDEYQAIASNLYNQASRVPGNRVELEPYLKIAGFKRRIAVYPDSGSCSKLCTAIWYWLTGLLLCTCPFRCWFDLRSAKAHYTVVKCVGV